MLQLSDKWAPFLTSQPETGMSYQVVSITLTDGSCFVDAVIVGGCITRIRGRADIPFVEDQIAEIRVTHGKWNWASDT